MSLHKRRRRPQERVSRIGYWWCRVCERNGWAEGLLGCEPFDVRGRPRVPLSWPAELGIPDDNPCKCGARVGYLHHHPCDVEVCPWAEEHPDEGEQLLCCDCVGDDEDDEP